MLWQVQPDDTLRFRCHVGHAYTAEAWEGAQTEHLEQALWSAVRERAGDGGEGRLRALDGFPSHAPRLGGGS